MKWIDTHVHIFSRNSEAASKGPLLKSRNDLNDADGYLAELESQKPDGVVVVDFSKSENSEHVIEGVQDLKARQIPVAGVIKGDVKYPKTAQWLEQDEIQAIRVYAKEGVPSLDGDAWQNLFSVLRAQNKHVLVFGAYTNIAATVAQIPQDIAVVIDHLGLPSLDDVEGYEVLLQALKERGNVYLKGPGYRTSLEVEKIIPLVRKAKELLGSEALMLGATDGPFAGPIVDPKSPEKGKPLADFINYQTVQQYTATLAEGVSDDQQEQEQLLYGNAKRFYKF